MSMATGVVLFLIGAILAFAVHLNVSFVSLSTVGYILMAGGVVVFLIGLGLTLRGRQSVTTARSTVDPASGDRVTQQATTHRDIEV